MRCLPDSASKCDVTPVDYAAKEGTDNGDQKCLPNFASQLFLILCLTLAFHAGSLLLLKTFDFLGGANTTYLPQIHVFVPEGDD